MNKDCKLNQIKNVLIKPLLIRCIIFGPDPVINVRIVSHFTDYSWNVTLLQVYFGALDSLAQQGRTYILKPLHALLCCLPYTQIHEHPVKLEYLSNFRFDRPKICQCPSIWLVHIQCFWCVMFVLLISDDHFNKSLRGTLQYLRKTKEVNSNICAQYGKGSQIYIFCPFQQRRSESIPIEWLCPIQRWCDIINSCRGILPKNTDISYIYINKNWFYLWRPRKWTSKSVTKKRHLQVKV